MAKLVAFVAILVTLLFTGVFNSAVAQDIPSITITRPIGVTPSNPNPCTLRSLEEVPYEGRVFTVFQFQVVDGDGDEQTVVVGIGSGGGGSQPRPLPFQIAVANCDVIVPNAGGGSGDGSLPFTITPVR